MRKVVNRIGQVVTVVALVAVTAGTAYMGVSLAGCESDWGTGFCAPLDGPPVVSWDRGPGGTTVTVGPVSLHG